ncbi:polysaccharide biosynthesis/export family protein [Hyphomicrobium sp.]|uniref:polysaccharide biosynthesis/export family protein n=1 Tax=Hyphomicrobium sp. TaxID=82 RepID=UPI002FDD1AAA
MFDPFQACLRRSVVAAGVCIACAVVMIPAQGVAEPRDAAGAGTSQATPVWAGERLVHGDRIKIMFFEHVDFPDEGKAGGPPIKSFYQRADLSGEYAIEADGSLFLPRLGGFEAEGQTTHDIQDRLADTFEKQFGRACDVTISLIDREPVFVTGEVRNAGSYRYVKNMMVLHAVALAGGADLGRGRESIAVEVMRERERHDAALLDLKRLLAERARLEAERDDKDTISVPSRLQEIALGSEIADLVEAQTALLRQSQKMFAEAERRLTDHVAAARRDVDAARERAGKQGNLISLRNLRLDDLLLLKQQGDLRSTNVTLAKVELVEAEARLLDITSELQTRQSLLAQKEHELRELRDERQGRIAADLAHNLSQLTASERLVASISAISNVLAAGVPIPGAKNQRSSLKFEIVRPGGRATPTAMAADEMTPLMPGDVLRVRIGSTSPTGRDGTGDINGRFSN